MNINDFDYNLPEELIAQVPSEKRDECRLLAVNMDNGETVECVIDTIFEMNGQDYIVLIPLGEDGEPIEEGECYIYRYNEDEEGNPSLGNIESDEEYEAVLDRFDEILDEEAFEEIIQNK